MKRGRGYHILFGVTLMAIIALAIWWTVFFMNSTNKEHAAKLKALADAAEIAAIKIGHGTRAPAPGPLPGALPLEVIRLAAWKPGKQLHRALPRYPGLAIRPTAKGLQRVEEKIQRRRLMLLGEGSLFCLLIGICTIMLYRMIRQEQRYRRRMEAFISSVTHEMKTPLAGIMSLLQTFADGNIPEEEQARLYAMGLREAERLEHMVDNILISGSLRAERYQLHCEQINLRKLLSSFVEHRRRYLIGRPETISLNWEAKQDELAVWGDSHAIHVILENLTDNAFKYGGASPLITLRVHQGTGRIKVSVEDRGIGFSEEQGKMLFIPFRRAMDERDSVHHGTGLGLPIARALAERMKGTLTAKSDGPGKGSQFTLTLNQAANKV